jgi:small subunit ribosomal protein S16
MAGWKRDPPGALSSLRGAVFIERSPPVPTRRYPLIHSGKLGSTTPVAVKIKLKRLGKIRQPYYRIIVADARSKRDGRAIEEIGKYHPKDDPSFIEVNSERVQYWLGVGAQPTEPVLRILKVTGDWQRYKGEPGAEGTLKLPTPKPDRKAVFEAAAKEAMGEATGAATTPKSKGRRKKADDKTDATADTKAANTKADTEPKAKGKAKTEGKSADTANETPKAEKSEAKPKAKAKSTAKAKAGDKSETKSDAKSGEAGESKSEA